MSAFHPLRTLGCASSTGWISTPAGKSGRASRLAGFVAPKQHIGKMSCDKSQHGVSGERISQPWRYSDLPYRGSKLDQKPVECWVEGCSQIASILHRMKPYCGKHALALLDSRERP